MRSAITAWLVAASSFLLAGLAQQVRAQQQQQQQDGASNETDSKTILQVIADNSELSSLTGLLTGPDVDAVTQLLNTSGPYTVFAPTNDAFNAANLNNSDVAFLNNALLYHVLDKSMMSVDITELQFPTTMLKNETYVNLNGQGQVVGVAKNNNSVTISYGVGKVNVTTADVKASNGFIHIIDAVLVPPKKPSEVAAQANFTKLTELLKQANLSHSIDNLEGATLFAPTDDAFGKLGNNASLSGDELTSLLKLHVAPTVAYSTDISEGKTISSESGDDLSFHVSGSNVTVNGAGVVKTDVLTWNGVIHVIDAVLLRGQKSSANATNSSTNSPNNTNSGSSRAAEHTFANFALVVAFFIMFF